ncbi:dTMP kinase [Actinocorallia sp. A-T 12471]|uniref:dTMP kinase n=1 Tax=Actinocorallia sp. A-T 12471 TaxID=3089813 RepID=UPI0029CFB20B|nr:dTMP kinase [Actinocorallia sp. A-T 12471]MDX6742453.1 dTMP kinase [Actinocorallia sp. A-T 12471]
MNKPGVLSIKPFRRLWIAVSLSSLGDWLSLLALTAAAHALTGSYAAQAYAVGGVLAAKLLPVLVFGPVAGALADRLDRRAVMLGADVVRFGLLLSVPLVGRLEWLFAAAFLTELASLLRRPAEDATVPALVPPKLYPRAKSVAVWTVYGSAPLAGVVFAVTSLLAGLFLPGPDLALYVSAGVFLVGAVVVFTLKTGPTRHPVSVPSLPGRVLDGWKYAGGSELVRGLVIGLFGVSLAGGLLIGVLRPSAAALGAGDAGYGMLFAAVFLGLASGMLLGPRILRDLSRRRLFGLAVLATALVLVPAALIQELVAVFVLSGVVGFGAGVAGATAEAVIGQEVRDDLRDRTSSYLRSLVRVVLTISAVLAPAASGALGQHVLALGDLSYRIQGTAEVLLIGAVVTLLAGLGAFRLTDDRRGIPLKADLYGALQGVAYVPPVPGVKKKERGLFIAFEGGEGAGKTTQSRLLAIWLRDNGFDVVNTREPGATKVGMRLRAILLDRETTALSDRAESLLYAADRAQHVDAVIRPALEHGSVVITDRYVDSSLAYQAYGREQAVEEIREVNAWATGGLVPDLTVLLDVPPSVGLNRFASPADRIESEPEDFHNRVRRGFRALADADPDRYLVVDASQDQDAITRLIQDKVRSILPDPVPASAEDVTSTFPAIRDL